MLTARRQQRPAARDAKQSLRMVAYREQKKKEMAELKDNIRKLERIRSFLHTTTLARPSRSGSLLLPWHEVAKALADLRHLSESQNQALRSQLKHHEALVSEMYNWAASFHIKNCPDPKRTSWRHVTLLQDPALRKLGKEWITEHMYHNTDTIFRQHGFPPLHSSKHLLQDFNFTFDNDEGYHFTTRHMTRLPGSVNSFLDHYKSTLLQFQSCILDYDPSMTTTVEDGATIQYTLVTPRHEYVNLLCATYRTMNRVVFVGRQIEDDEAYGACKTTRQRTRMFWCDLHTLEDGSNVGRGLWIQTQSFTKEGGVVPLERDAAEYDIDLTTCPPHLWEATFPSMFVDAVLQNARSVADRRHLLT
ncbi:hypothetical protein, variant [Aphanomyces invadans]|uniref:Uncharacterized protein n=1 Tax=Aphanomyces invadans TaxID=157072 RepID=A0A024U1W1_9STRA|nr:hypothetical protein, variant [Aphanomyces invadans]ETV99602.1 hypothetical protein, variant [Aphanomyces invadans]|eukprot:XP_008872158.1 hypothetical protein, variant [Aphanomyces invadans]